MKLTELLIVVLASHLSIGACFAEITIVDNNRALAIVVIADNASVTARHAAGELTRHIQAATGVMLPVLTESNARENDQRRTLRERQQRFIHG